MRNEQHLQTVQNVVARVKLARDFSSPEALREYLHQHPNADKSKHHVVKEDGSRGSGKAQLKKKIPSGVADDIAKTWKGRSGNAVDGVRKMIEDEREVPHNMLEKAINLLHGEATKPGVDKAKAKALKELRDKLKSHAKE